MKIITSVVDMQYTALALKCKGSKIGLVPTMGYLHEGHLSLLHTIRDKCDILVTSIFINPTQFGPNEDLDKYPRNIERDEKLLEENGCDILFHPSGNEIYPSGYSTYVNVKNLTEGLCSRNRPEHFIGVATIVTKMFLITQCNIACFGQKDAQQAAVIRRMTRDLNLTLEIVIAPIVREPDGLAISSRNVYLSTEERQKALCLKQSLDLAEKLIANGEKDANIIITKMRGLIGETDRAGIEYIEIVNADDLTPVSRIEGRVLIALAVKIGSTRLIDNVIVDEITRDDT